MNTLSDSGECPICGYETSLLFSVPCDYRKPANSKPYQVYWCNRCDYGQVWARPSKAEISRYYQLENYYTHFAANAITDQDKGSFIDRLRTHISWRFDYGEELTPREAMSLLQVSSRTVCEIGCGNGENLLRFVDKGFSVTGVEPDPVARSVAEKADINVFDGTAEELPEAILKNKYDVVLMSHVLEHCLDINAAISNAKAILNNGGVFIVETPNCKSHGFVDYEGLWPWSDIPRHLNFFTPSSLNTILIKHGLRVKDIKYRGFYRQFSNPWIENEKEIWRSFSSCKSEQNPSPNFKLRAWKLLFKSLFSSKTAKYDSIRLIAITP